MTIWQMPQQSVSSKNHPWMLKLWGKRIRKTIPEQFLNHSRGKLQVPSQRNDHKHHGWNTWSNFISESWVSIFVVFLPKRHILNSIFGKHQPQITEQYSKGALWMCQAGEQQSEKLFQNKADLTDKTINIIFYPGFASEAEKGN